MNENEFMLPQWTEAEQTTLNKPRTMEERVVQYIREGKTKREAEIAGGVPRSLIDRAYSVIRPWELPQNQLYETSNLPSIHPLTDRQQRVWDMTQKCRTQKEIAKALKCSQSTVAFTLKQIRQIKENADEIRSSEFFVLYKARIHLFVHGMELWDKVKGVCLGSKEFAQDIDEAISLGASEVISPHLPYSPHQLDKLAMDIILATGGRCIIMADCYATNAITDVHTVYFIRDCIHTKDFPAGKGYDNRELPVNCSICYLDDWIRCLGVTLSKNDEETVNNFNFWRGTFDKRT